MFFSDTDENQGPVAELLAMRRHNLRPNHLRMVIHAPWTPQAHDGIVPRRRFIPLDFWCEESLVRGEYAPSTGRGRLRACRQAHPQSLSRPVCLAFVTSPCVVKLSFFVLAGPRRGFRNGTKFKLLHDFVLLTGNECQLKVAHTQRA